MENFFDLKRIVIFQKYFKEMETNTIIQQILEIPYAPLLIERIKRVLEEEQFYRQRFYEMKFPRKSVEFINGEIIIHAPESKLHNFVQNCIFQLLNVFVIKQGIGYVSHSLMISLTRNDYKPDACFFNKTKADLFEEDQVLFPAPDLVVEVLSSGTKAKDKGIKFTDYQAHGINEYWMIDTKLQTIEKYVLEDGEYELAGTFNKKQTIQSAVVEGFNTIFLETLSNLLK